MYLSRCLLYRLSHCNTQLLEGTVGVARIAVTEDSVLLREGLVRLLEEAGHEVVGTFGCADDLMKEIPNSPFDVVLMDVRMPPTFTDEGIRAAKTISSSYPDIAVLILSQYVESVYAAEIFAESRGGIGYLLKDRVVSLDDISAAIDRLLAGGTVLDPEVVRSLIRARKNPLHELTPRETDILEMMAEGHTNQEIAEISHVGVGTVEKQVSSIFNKLHLEPGTGGHRRVLAVLTWLRSCR